MMIKKPTSEWWLCCRDVNQKLSQNGDCMTDMLIKSCHRMTEMLIKSCHRMVTIWQMSIKRCLRNATVFSEILIKMFATENRLCDRDSSQMLLQHDDYVVKIQARYCIWMLTVPVNFQDDRKCVQITPINAPGDDTITQSRLKIREPRLEVLDGQVTVQFSSIRFSNFPEGVSHCNINTCSN